MEYGNFHRCSQRPCPSDHDEHINYKLWTPLLKTQMEFSLYVPTMTRKQLPGHSTGSNRYTDTYHAFLARRAELRLREVHTRGDMPSVCVQKYVSLICTSAYSCGSEEHNMQHFIHLPTLMWTKRKGFLRVPAGASRCLLTDRLVLSNSWLPWPVDRYLDCVVAAFSRQYHNQTEGFILHVWTVESPAKWHHWSNKP